MFKSYEDAYRRSLEDREGFWSIAAGAIQWEKKWDRVLDESQAPIYRWFTGGRLNTCYNAIDWHVENGRRNQVAIIYDSPVTGTVRKITYGELLEQVSLFAGVLKSLGVVKGDRVVIYMPMVPEAAVAMFACARIGAIHSLVFGGFAPNELAVRIEDAKPRVMLSASCGIEPKGAIPYKPLLDKAIELSSHKPEKCVIFQRRRSRPGSSRAGTSTGPPPSRAPPRRGASPWRPRTRCTSSTPRAPRASPRAW